jgi:pyruvate/2-oxoglutarate dehydrogenase complex dihydrolipoamide acyltransferase (E2) component
MFLRLPELSTGSKETAITAWLVELNGRVRKGQDLVEVSTDKATFDISSPCDGTLTRTMKSPGETAEKGEVIAEITEL